MQKTGKIGIFDSGVGGLSVFREIRKVLPEVSIVYFADQANVPYGPRPLLEVRSFSKKITEFLISEGAELIVVACNAASAAALHDLRQEYPTYPFVGMEPAVKPAAEYTKTGVVGVLATPATFQGELYASVVERFANEVKIMQNTCPGLVKSIESGDLIGPEPRSILENAILPMLAENIDTIVLGCTHYPFVIPLIQSIAGEKVRVIDPAPAIARQTARMMHQTGILPQSQDQPEFKMFTSGDSKKFAFLLKTLLQESYPIHQARWIGTDLIQADS